MHPDFVSALWRMLDKLRGTIAADDYISAVSQIFVIGKLADHDKQFARIAYPEGPISLSYLPDLLHGATQACKRLEIHAARQLVDPSDPCWSGMSSALVHDLLESNLFTDLLVGSDEELASELLRWAMQEAHIPLATPPEVTHLMRALLRDTDHLLLPFDASCAAVIEAAPDAPRVSVFPQMHQMGKLVSRVAFVAGIDLTVERLDMSALQERALKANVLLIPPWSAKYTRNQLAHSGNLPGALHDIKKLSSEQLALALIASHVKGRVAVLVPAGLLFQAGSGARYREWLVREAGLTTVVELPGRLLENTFIATAVLLLDPGATNRDSIRLVAAESDRYLDEPRKGRYVLKHWQQLVEDINDPDSVNEIIDVGIPELLANDCLLTPGRYIAKEGGSLDELIADRRTEKLSSVATILSSSTVSPPKGRAVESYTEVLISDFGDDGSIRGGSKVRQFDEAGAARAARDRLRSGDILLGTRGTIGKVAMVADDAAPRLLAGQTTVAIRLAKDSPISDPTYLLRYLSLPEVREHLKSLAGGATVRFIRNKDLGNLPVVIPSAEDQAKVAAVHAEIAKVAAEAKRLRQKAQDLSNTALDCLAQGGAA